MCSVTGLDDQGIPHRLLLTSWSLHLQSTFTKINAKALQLNSVPNADSWAGNPFILYFLALTCEIRNPHQSCTGGSRSAAVAMRDFAGTWGSSAVGVVSTLLNTCLQKVFPFLSNIQAKCYSQPLPQCLPSLKRNKRWLDPDVPYLAHFAVFCLIIPGYELEVFAAALAASLCTEIQTVWFSHYYLLRLLLHVCLLFIGSWTQCVKICVDILQWEFPCWWEPGHVCVYISEANGYGDTLKLMCSACSFECSLPWLIAGMENTVHPV